MDYNCISLGGEVPQQQQQPTRRMYTQHQSSTFTYFTQQALRAGYTAPHFGNTLDHFQHQPINMHEAIWRQNEKERIREEIIAEEIALRRMLELKFELRREVMLERQLANHSEEGFSSFPSPGMSFSSALPLLKQQSDARSVEERLARSLEGRRMGSGISLSGLGAGSETRRPEIVPFEERVSEIPFQQRSVEPKISKLKYVSRSDLQLSPEFSNEKDRIILLGEATTNLSGAKRKALASPVEFANKPPSCSLPKNEWSCAMCQVSSTSKRALDDHLRGKKHKSKEASLRAQNGKNYTIGLFPKKPKTIVEANDKLNQEQVEKLNIELFPGSKSSGGSSLILSEKGANDNGAPALPLHNRADSPKENANAPEKKQKKEHKQKTFKFWCETCKVKALSEKSMEAHRIGKKHRARIRALNGCGSATSSTKVESRTNNETLEDVNKREIEVVCDNHVYVKM